MTGRKNTRERADALVRRLDESPIASRDSHTEKIRGLADDLARAYALDSGRNRFLALAETRDNARLLASGLRRSRKRAVQEAEHARQEREYLLSGDIPLDDVGRFHSSQMRGFDALALSHLHEGSYKEVRSIIRDQSRDLAHEAAIESAGGTPWVTRLSRRLIELALSARVRSDRAAHRRGCWSRLDELDKGGRSRGTRLGYAFRVLIRGFE